jgi:hypothetical protein
MRTTQFIGLSEEAKTYLASFGQEYVLRVTLEINEDGDSKILSSQKIKKNLVKEIPNQRITLGMFEEEIGLSDYILPDGTRLEEHVQFEEWSSGPVIATGLYETYDNEFDSVSHMYSKHGKLVIGWSDDEYEQFIY